MSKHFDADQWYFGSLNARQNMLRCGVEIALYADELDVLAHGLQPERLPELQRVAEWCYDVTDHAQWGQEDTRT